MHVPERCSYIKVTKLWGNSLTCPCYLSMKCWVRELKAIPPQPCMCSSSSTAWIMLSTMPERLYGGGGDEPLVDKWMGEILRLNIVAGSRNESLPFNSLFTPECALTVSTWKLQHIVWFKLKKLNILYCYCQNAFLVLNVFLTHSK